MMVIASIVIAALVLLIIVMGALMHQMAERIRDLKEWGPHTGETPMNDVEDNPSHLHEVGVNVRVIPAPQGLDHQS